MTGKTAVNRRINHRKPGSFGGRGQETSHRCGCTFIDIRRPEVEREQRNLESQSRQHQEGDADCHQIEAAEIRTQVIKTGFAGETVDQAETIEQDCRSQRAEEHVFETRFGGLVVILQESGQQVEWDGGCLDGQIQHHQVRRGGHQAHAQRRSHKQEIGFGTAVEMVRIHEEQRRYSGSKDKEHLEGKTQPVEAQHPAEDQDRVRMGGQIKG